ncbi:hypothetical protein T439DRAFT_89358 [Meredithblackwellia eburnea MCA 4105]
MPAISRPPSCDEGAGGPVGGAGKAVLVSVSDNSQSQTGLLDKKKKRKAQPPGGDGFSQPARASGHSTSTNNTKRDGEDALGGKKRLKKEEERPITQALSSIKPTKSPSVSPIKLSPPRPLPLPRRPPPIDSPPPPIPAIYRLSALFTSEITQHGLPTHSQTRGFPSAFIVPYQSPPAPPLPPPPKPIDLPGSTLLPILNCHPYFIPPLHIKHIHDSYIRQSSPGAEYWSVGKGGFPCVFVKVVGRVVVVDGDYTMDGKLKAWIYSTTRQPQLWCTPRSHPPRTLFLHPRANPPSSLRLLASQQKRSSKRLRPFPSDR